MLSWTSNGQAILNISGLDNIELIVKKATEYSTTDEGAEFAQRVKAIQ